MAVAAFAAGELITAGEAVYVSGDGFLYRASAADIASAQTAGIAIDTGNAGTLIRVNADAIYYGYTNLTPGEGHYLSVATSGLIVAYSGWQEEFNTNAGTAYLQFVGRAISSSGVEVELSPPVQMNYPLS
jgi:hypothetical protein